MLRFTCHAQTGSPHKFPQFDARNSIFASIIVPKCKAKEAPSQLTSPLTQIMKQILCMHSFTGPPCPCWGPYISGDKGLWECAEAVHTTTLCPNTAPSGKPLTAHILDLIHLIYTFLCLFVSSIIPPTGGGGGDSIGPRTPTTPTPPPPPRMRAMTICLCHGGICKLSIRCSWPPRGPAASN